MFSSHVSRLWSSEKGMYKLAPSGSEERFLQDRLDGEDSDDSPPYPSLALPKSWHWRSWIYLYVNIALFLSSLLVMFGTFRYAARQENSQAAVRSTSYFSILGVAMLNERLAPILQSLRVEMKDVQVNGTLYPPRHPSWSRKKPGTKETEDMWESFEPQDVFPITREDVIRLGKDPETAVKLPHKHFGLGDDAYAASLDITHKLHCLNELRRMTFSRHPDDPSGHHEGDGKDEQKAKTDAFYKLDTFGRLWWYHLRHCVDMLTQDIMCHADADVYVYQYRDTQVSPFPDFSINRKCRDFDQLLRWRSEHKVDLDKYSAVMTGERDWEHKVIPFEKEFYEMNGFVDSESFPNGEGFAEYWAEHWI